jgi:lipoprotein-releasing system permease protein
VIPATLVALAIGAVVLAASVALFAGFGFERFVGLRYLLRSRKSKTARAGLAITAGLTLLGLAALFGGRGHARSLETAGVTLTLLGGLGLLLFVLLRIFSVFTTVSTMGVVLGVASLVVVLAVTSGFEREFEAKVLAVNAHLLVMSYGSPGMEDRERAADGYMKKLADLPGLVRISKFGMSAGEVMIGKVGATLKGIDLDNPGTELGPALIAGKLGDLARPAHCSVGPRWAAKDAGAAAKAEAAPAGGDRAPGDAARRGGDDDAEFVGRIVLGAELAHRIHAEVGDCITVVVPFAGREVDAQPISFPFQVVGLFRLGFHEYDTRLAYVGMADARKIGEARPMMFGVELRFADPKRALHAEADVIARVGYEPHVIDWQTLNQNMFAALEMQKVIIALFLMIIIVVAAFNIVASLTMIVLAKVREMAILAAMGARRRALMRLFVVAGSLVGFVGVGLGIVYGLGICALAAFYGYPLDPKVYAIAQLPVDVNLGELLAVAGTTQFVCVLATLYPALRAGRLKVVDGLRYG